MVPSNADHMESGEVIETSQSILWINSPALEHYRIS